MAFFGQLANFTAGYRKRFLIPFGLFSPNDNIGFIASIDPGQMATPTGTVDGNNAIFTVPTTTGLINNVYRNGVLQVPGIHYTLVSGTITFIAPYIPQAGPPADIVQVQLF